MTMMVTVMRMVMVVTVMRMMVVVGAHNMQSLWTQDMDGGGRKKQAPIFCPRLISKQAKE